MLSPAGGRLRAECGSGKGPEEQHCGLCWPPSARENCIPSSRGPTPASQELPAQRKQEISQAGSAGKAGNAAGHCVRRTGLAGPGNTAVGWGNSPAGGCQRQRRGKLRLWNTPGARQRLLPAPAPACPPSAAGPYLPDGLRDAEAAAGPDEAHGRVQAHPVAHGDIEGLGAVVVAPQHLGSQKGRIRH